MELRVLRYFVAVAEEGSVTEGASRVHVSQPSVSRQIASLEREIGTPLFERGQGALKLTHAGREFLGRARSLIRDADEAKVFASFPEVTDVQLTVVAQSTTIERTIAPFTAHRGSSFPLIDAIVASPAEVFDRVDAIGADFGISTIPPPADWASRFITQVGISAHVPSEHPLFGRASVELEELVGYPLICMDRSHAARTSFDEAIARQGLGSVKLTEVKTANLAKAHAASGRGVAVLTDLPSFGMRRTRIMADGTQVRMNLFGGWNKRHFASAHIEMWVSELSIWTAGLPDIRILDAHPDVEIPGFDAFHTAKLSS